jgi:uncharacterized protein (TIGR02271 family)
VQRGGRSAPWRRTGEIPLATRPVWQTAPILRQKHCNKDRVSRGEVRIRKEVITETQTVQVPVTREELVVERRPVDQATRPPGPSDEIRIPLSEERASVDTSTVVREEVAVSRDAAGSVGVFPLDMPWVG